MELLEEFDDSEFTNAPLDGDDDELVPPFAGLDEVPPFAGQEEEEAPVEDAPWERLESLPLDDEPERERLDSLPLTETLLPQFVHTAANSYTSQFAFVVPSVAMSSVPLQHRQPHSVAASAIMNMPCGQSLAAAAAHRSTDAYTPRFDP